MVVFRLFEKLRYSNKEEDGKMVAIQISPKIEGWVDRPQIIKV